MLESSAWSGRKPYRVKITWLVSMILSRSRSRAGTRGCGNTAAAAKEHPFALAGGSRQSAAACSATAAAACKPCRMTMMHLCTASKSGIERCEDFKILAHARDAELVDSDEEFKRKCKAKGSRAMPHLRCTRKFCPRRDVKTTSINKFIRHQLGCGCRTKTPWRDCAEEFRIAELERLKYEYSKLSFLVFHFLVYFF